MKRALVCLLCACALTAVGGLMLTSAPASAGVLQNVQIEFTARGAGAASALNSISVELYLGTLDGPVMVDASACTELPVIPVFPPVNPLAAERDSACQVPDGEYFLGLAGLADIDPAFFVRAGCLQGNNDQEMLPVEQYANASFTIGEPPGSPTAVCSVQLDSLVLAVVRREPLSVCPDQHRHYEPTVRVPVERDSDLGLCAAGDRL